MLWGILLCLLAAFAITWWALSAIKRHPIDPFEAPGEAMDETDVIEAITSPDLPAYGYERPAPAETVVYATPDEPLVLEGTLVEPSDWAQAMTVPAPAIVATPTSLADEWIAAFERGEQPDPDRFSQRMLAGAVR